MVASLESGMRNTTAHTLLCSSPALSLMPGITCSNCSITSCLSGVQMPPKSVNAFQEVIAVAAMGGGLTISY